MSNSKTYNINHCTKSLHINEYTYGTEATWLYYSNTTINGRCQLNQACACILKYTVNNTGLNLAASYFYTCSLFSRRISAFISFKHLAMSYMQYNKITKQHEYCMHIRTYICTNVRIYHMKIRRRSRSYVILQLYFGISLLHKLAACSQACRDQNLISQI